MKLGRFLVALDEDENDLHCHSDIEVFEEGMFLAKLSHNSTHHAHKDYYCRWILWRNDCIGRVDLPHDWTDLIDSIFSTWETEILGRPWTSRTTNNLGLSPKFYSTHNSQLEARFRVFRLKSMRMRSLCQCYRWCHVSWQQTRVGDGVTRALI